MGESGMSTKAKAVRIAAGSGAVLSLGASLIATAGPAGAATFNVTTTADAGAGILRQAILDANAAAGADTITFQAGLGTIGLTTGELDITDDLTITDPEGDVTVDAGGTSRIFYITAAGAVTITGLTLDSGSTTGRGGAVASFETDLTITGSTISGSSSDWGGGVFAEEGAVTITDTTFSDNSSDGYGGGLGVYEGSATITGSTFTGNVAYDHGGGASFDNITSVTVTDSTFTDNTSDDGYGGGLWAYDGESLTVTGSTFTGNGADGDGGGFGAEEIETVTVTDSTFTGNDAYSDGGGFSVYGGEHHLRRHGHRRHGHRQHRLRPGRRPGHPVGSPTAAPSTITGSTFSGNDGVNGGGVTIARMDVSDNARPRST